MKRNICNVLIITGFLFLFYRFVETTGSYSSIITEEQQEEALPALFYQILSASMAEKGTAKEYTKEEIYMTDMPLIFKTILCGDFDDIPWGEGLGDEIEVYYSAYEKRDLWQFTLRDLDGDGRNELVIRDEDGHVLCFFEQYGDVETSTGMICYCTMEEGDWYSASKLLEGERCSSVFYLDNGEQVYIYSREDEKGNYYLDIEIQRSIYRKGNYNRRKGQVQIIYDAEDNMEKEGIHYYIDDENVTKEEFEEWLYQQIFLEMIPIEEWGTVPKGISETETMVEYTQDQETDTGRSHEDESLEEMGDLEEDPVLCYDDELLSELWISTEDLENRPDYYFFTNSGTGHYYLDLEFGAALSIADYVQETELSDREWELKRITYMAGQYHAYVESDRKDELYLIFREGSYIILADIRQKPKEETGQRITYSSMLEWHSFGEWYNKEQKGEMDEDGYSVTMGNVLYDMMYYSWGRYAVYDYLECQKIPSKGKWMMEEDHTYVGRNGYIADICFTNGSEEIELLIDVYEKTYAVVKGIVLDE